MKKYISLMLLVGFVLMQGVGFAATEPSDTGIRKRVVGASASVPTKVFQLVRFANRGANAIVNSGDVVVWDTNSDDGVTVALTTTSGDGSIAGIAVSQIVSPDSGSSSAADDEGRNNWGYIQVYGPALANITAGGAGANGAVTKPFITSTDSGVITGYVEGEVIANALATRVGGFFLDTPAATATQVEVFVATE